MVVECRGLLPGFTPTLPTTLRSLNRWGDIGEDVSAGMKGTPTLTGPYTPPKPPPRTPPPAKPPPLKPPPPPTAPPGNALAVATLANVKAIASPIRFKLGGNISGASFGKPKSQLPVMGRSGSAT